MSASRHLGFLALCALLTPGGGCAGPGSSAPPSPGPQPPLLAGQPEPRYEQALARLRASTDIHGRPIGQRPGSRATIVVVFASWCQPCRDELAMLGQLAGDEPRLRVLGVNAYEELGDRSDLARLRAFVAVSAPWLQVVRADERLFSALGRPGKIPSLFLYDSEGALVEAYLRSERPPPTREQLQEALEALLARSPG